MLLAVYLTHNKQRAKELSFPLIAFEMGTRTFPVIKSACPGRVRGWGERKPFDNEPFRCCQHSGCLRTTALHAARPGAAHLCAEDAAPELLTMPGAARPCSEPGRGWGEEEL